MSSLVNTSIIIDSYYYSTMRVRNRGLVLNPPHNFFYYQGVYIKTYANNFTISSPQHTVSDMQNALNVHRAYFFMWIWGLQYAKCHTCKFINMHYVSNTLKVHLVAGIGIGNAEYAFYSSFGASIWIGNRKIYIPIFPPKWAYTFSKK